MKQKSTLMRLLFYTRPYKGYLIGALISAILSVSLTLLAPVLIGDAIDLIIGPSQVDMRGVFGLLIWLAASLIGVALFQWLMTLCTNIVAYRTVKDIRSAVFDRLEDVPLKYIDSHAHGDLISRVVNDVDQISDGLIQGFSQLFTGIITILGTLGFMLYINVPIALVVVVLTPLSFFVASFIAKGTFHMFKEQSAVKGEISGFIDEMVGNQKVVKAFGYEDRAQAQFEEINSRLYDCGVKAQFYSAMTNPCTRFVNGVVYAAVGIVGALSAIGGGLSVGQLSCFLTYANQYTKPFNEISGVITEFQSALACARRVFAVLDEPLEQAESSAALPEGTGTVQIEDVSFSYHPDKPLIQNFNLTAKAGQRIAIVGPTGCGKTTLINLLMRFYDVDAGCIKINQTDIGSVSRESVRKMYGMVLQESWLFAGTIFDNIAYGKPHATQEEVIAAAKAAHAHSFIKRLPNGYQTTVSEDGGNLSQGQRQLLCIARIMLTDPPMLILDEATSSIDTRTEIQVQRAFAKMMQGRTSFVVAHRLSTIKEADCILVMKDGQVVEQGNHEQLLSQNGFYATLYNSQFVPSDL